MTLKEDGLATFYKGYAPSCLRAVFVNACIFTAFSAMKRAMEDD